MKIQVSVLLGFMHLVFSGSVSAYSQELNFSSAMAARWALVALRVEYDTNSSAAYLNDLLNKSATKNFKRKIQLSQLQQAFGNLQACRVSNSHLNLSLTAAEHYMYMRLRSAETGDLRYRELPGRYMVYKKEKIENGSVADLQTTEQPVSPPDENVKEWGEKGAEHGFSDYERFTGEKPSNGIAAYSEAVAFMLSPSYVKYADARSCVLTP